MRNWPARLPFFYGWVIVAIAFVTMAIGVTARTAFSLLMPPLIDEFGWERGLAAGAFSFGFLVSAIASPLIGRVMDARGPQVVILAGVILLGTGLLLAPLIAEPWHLYATLGLLVGGGANLMSFTAQSLYLPYWFQRRRALAISIAFSGVGVGAIFLLPWLQDIIVRDGWRTACMTMGVIVLAVAGPLNLFVRRRPEDVGLKPDGAAADESASHVRRTGHVVDAAWVATEWTLARAIRTWRFWMLACAFFCGTFAWYAVQVHQTKYLIEVGFTPTVAAWALGFVSAIAIPGQIALAGLSDRIGREWVWSIATGGFALSYAALLALEHSPSPLLLYIMIGTQGFLGYSLTAVMGPMTAEIFEGAHYGAIFGSLSVPLMAGGAAGPWVAGVVHDATGSYRLAFLLSLVLCLVSIATVWLAAPRKVRLVPGRAPT